MREGERQKRNEIFSNVYTGRAASDDVRYRGQPLIALEGFRCTYSAEGHETKVRERENHFALPLSLSRPIADGVHWTVECLADTLSRTSNVDRFHLEFYLNTMLCIDAIDTVQRKRSSLSFSCHCLSFLSSLSSLSLSLSLLAADGCLENKTKRKKIS